MKGIELISIERKRQIEQEGWTAEHDASHTKMTLAIAAAAYALNIAAQCDEWAASWREHFQDYSDAIWPFDEEWFKPTHDDPIRQLVKAGALIAAEIDRLKE